jgi:hypothetical protein
MTFLALIPATFAVSRRSVLIRKEMDAADLWNAKDFVNADLDV